MQTEPSPTAEATRLTLPARTSPTAKTRGRLVSNRQRRARERPARGAAGRRRSRSAPVCTNPLSSRATQPRSHAVLGLRRRSSRRRGGSGGSRSLRRRRRARSRARGGRRPSSADELGARVEGDVGRLLDAADRGSATWWRRGPGRGRATWTCAACAREEHRGLAGGVAAADDDDLLARAALGLDVRRRVVDADALEAREVGDVERRYSAPVAMTMARARTDSPFDSSIRVRPSRRSAIRDGAARDRELGAELLGLGERAPGERLPGDARGEAEVVLDLRARRRPVLRARRPRRPARRAPPTRRRRAAASPPGPAPKTTTSCTAAGSMRGVQAEAVGDLGVRGVLEHARRRGR